MSLERAFELQEHAWNLQAENRLDEAFEACQEALCLMEECEGSSSPDVANLLVDLAEIENDRQNFKAALALAVRAQAIEDALGEQFTGETAVLIRARTFNMLGDVRRVLGEYIKAEADLETALAILTSEFGEASEAVADARNNLGILYKYWGRFDDALQLYAQALSTIIVIYGERSLEASAIFHNIGGVLHSRGDFAAAEEPGRKAWNISSELLDEDDPRVMRDAAAYAAILDGLERYGESETIYLRVLAVMSRIFGREHYEVAATLHSLGAVYTALGRLEEAEQHYRMAQVLKEKLLGQDNPDTALTYNNLGELLNKMGRTGESVPLLQKAVVVLEKKLTPGHPHLAATRKNLQDALSSFGGTKVI